MFVGRSGTLAKVALVYPGSYEASITSLATHIAYYLLGSYPEILVDRFTLDNIHLSAIHSLSLRKFDVVLLMLGYELDYTNALRMLIENGISPAGESRGRPVIIAGGSAISANPLPMSGFVDAVVIGEGEGFFSMLPNLCTLLPNKKAFLEVLSSKGVYVPSLHCGEKVRKSYVQDLDSSFYPLYQIRSLVREPVFGIGYAMEVSRGCPCLCSFCMEAFITYPFRIRSYGKVLSYVVRGLEANMVDRVVFYSLSFFDHPSADRLLEELSSMKVKYSIPSLRVDTLNEYRVQLISSGGQKTLTIAPETNSARMKCAIRKYTSEDSILKVVGEALKLGMDVKMYYMVGLPYETADDVAESVKFLKSLTHLLERYRKRVRIAVNPLIPKACTPMQYFPLIGRGDYIAKLKMLRNGLPARYFEVSSLSYSVAYVQSLISLGGRELGKLLLRLATRDLSLSNVRPAAEGLEASHDFVFRFKDPSVEMPWDFIDLGLSIRPFYDHIVSRCIS